MLDLSSYARSSINYYSRDTIICDKSKLVPFFTGTVINPLDSTFRKYVNDFSLDDFSIVLDFADKSNYGYIHNDIFFDCMFNYALYYRDNLQGILGFNPTYDSLEVGQIQSSKKNINLLGGLRWEKLLISYLESVWSTQDKSLKVEIIGSKNNLWVEIGALPLSRAKLRYDVTATRMGYRENPNLNYDKLI